MSRRSLTLLETLIALTLVLAMAALIVPSMLKNMEERSFEAATDVTKEQLMMARAHAQATGNPVEVTYRPDTSQVQARWFMPWVDQQSQSAKDVDAAGSSATGNPLGLLSPAAPASRGQANEIAEPWAVREIDRGIRIASRPPVTEDSDATEMGPELPEQLMVESSAGYQELEKGQEVRLAVFMPDGSALMGEPVWLNDDKGRCGKFIINPWSGLPMFERLGELAEKTQQNSSDKSGKQSDKANPDGRSADTFAGPRGGFTETSGSDSKSDDGAYDEFGLGE